jgi:oxygen-independent coproporphyrinogen-3 oxidase
MPDTPEKLEIFKMTIDQLTDNGYVFIGMDHFAKPDDELAIAQREGELHRNFQGYTTQPESDLLSFGMTSISMLQDVYIQNHKKLKDFYAAIEADEIPIERGCQLTRDDLIRRTAIMELMCQFRLSASDLEEKYHLGFDIDFNDYFVDALPILDSLEADGLIHRWGDGIEVTARGRLLIRNIAAAFDPYLQGKGDRQQTFSKAI